MALMRRRVSVVRFSRCWLLSEYPFAMHRLPANGFIAILGVFVALYPATGRAADLQAYPNRPLRFVVPFPPSGTNDIIARALVPRLAEDLGQSVIVDNRGGANGIIGMDLTAKSPADGHT